MALPAELCAVVFKALSLWHSKVLTPNLLSPGAAGPSGPTEADVMSRLLQQAQIPQERIICERQGNDTLSSVLHCKAILETKWNNVASVIVCSSPYHNPRCALLLRLLNIHAIWGNMPKDRPYLSLAQAVLFLFA